MGFCIDPQDRERNYGAGERAERVGGCVSGRMQGSDRCVSVCVCVFCDKPQEFFVSWHVTEISKSRPKTAEGLKKLQRDFFFFFE